MLLLHKGELLFLLAAGTAPVALPAEWHLLWEERAAILEYDGGQPREWAEARALAAVMEAMRREGRIYKIGSCSLVIDNGQSTA
jgi:hypothetical protein